MDVLLAACVSTARSLRLHSTAALDRICTSNKQRMTMRRACWLLSCIDKEYAMRKCKFEVSESCRSQQGVHLPDSAHIQPGS